MEHVVFFTAPDGATAFKRVAGLEDAVRLVEHLRNVDGVHQVSVHPLGEEVPLAFRTYYRVEVPASDAVAPAAPLQAPTVEAVPALTVDAPVEPAPVFEVAQPAAPVEEVAEAAEVAEPAAEVAEVAGLPEQAEPVEFAPEPVPAVAGPRDDLKSLGFFAT